MNSRENRTPESHDFKEAPRLSVIVPLAPGEARWHDLIKQLTALAPRSEVIVVHAHPQPVPAWHGPTGMNLHQFSCPPGRARQQNLGAAAACGEWLWFLHADSRLLPETLPALQRFIDRGEDALGYFDLLFRNDGPRLARLNAWGANLRSCWFKLPFGDQGLLLPAQEFAALGGFDEAARYGEDHLLVWAAHRARLPVVRTGAALQTSARKYASNGWLRTTAKHVWLTLAQAWLAWRRLHRRQT